MNNKLGLLIGTLLGLVVLFVVFEYHKYQTHESLKTIIVDGDVNITIKYDGKTIKIPTESNGSAIDMESQKIIIESLEAIKKVLK